jgi:hypothetical protein
MKLQFLHTHTPLFVGKKNMPEKIQSFQVKDVEMSFDQKNGLVLVKYNGETALVPLSNVAAMIAAPAEARQQPPLKAVAQAVDAQVSSPTGHVFAGPGKGQR